MARGALIGWLPECPACGLEDMEVRRDKNGNPYAYCVDCSTQILTHGGLRGRKMLDRMKPVKTAEPEQPEKAAEPEQPEKNSEKKSGLLI